MENVQTQTALNLSGKQITELQKNQFDALDNLQEMSLSNNQIKELAPNQFANLFNLQWLHLSKNQIKEVSPNQFDSLVNLKRLDLSNNNIKEFTPNQFDALDKLEWLYLSNNQIQVLAPNQFKSLINLKILYLSNNQIKRVAPNQFDALVHFQELSLSKNQIKEVAPNQFTSLTNLKRLDLSNNYIKELDPNQFDALVNLQWLYLSNNQIKEVAPDQFKYLVNLQGLYFANNLIKELHENTFKELKNLNILDISCNNFEECKFASSFSELHSLTDLNLFNNKLGNIFFCNKSLKKLDLSSNNISTLDIQCMTLQYLKLSNNKIREFDMAKFPNLKTLYLHENLLENFDLSDHKNLQILTAFNCKLLEQNLLQIESLYQNKIELRTRESDLRTEHGHIESIHIIDKSGDFPQLSNFLWEGVPMFSVLTGKNGAGKSSLLKFVSQRLEDFYKNDQNPADCELQSKYFRERKTKIIPLTLKINDKIETFGNLSYFAQFLENDEKYCFSKYSHYYDWRYTQNIIETRNKASIYTFRTIETCLNYLRNDLENLNEFLNKQIEFKYKLIKEELDSETNNILFFRLFNREGDQEGVKIDDLSPGEHLILLLFLWQYIFGKFDVYGRTILLFDEPDVQILFTSKCRTRICMWKARTVPSTNP